MTLPRRYSLWSVRWFVIGLALGVGSWLIALVAGFTGMQLLAWLIP